MTTQLEGTYTNPQHASRGRVPSCRDATSLGTAVLLEALLDRPVERLLVASSMSVYGEGLYRNADGLLMPGEARPREQLERGEWELVDRDGRPLEPVPTPESKPLSLA